MYESTINAIKESIRAQDDESEEIYDFENAEVCSLKVPDGQVRDLIPELKNDIQVIRERIREEGSYTQERAL